jgi:hypothetical protein
MKYYVDDHGVVHFTNPNQEGVINGLQDYPSKEGP